MNFRIQTTGTKTTTKIARIGGTLATFAIHPNGAPVLLDTLGNLGNEPARIRGRARWTVSAFALDDDGRPTLIGAAQPTDPNGVVMTACTSGGGLSGPCATGAAVAPNGRTLYVTNLGTNTLAALAVQRDGSLRAAGSPVATNQGPIAALGGRQTRTADPNVTFDASASSDADGRVARYDWDFGDGQRAMDAGTERATAAQRVVVLPNATAAAR